MQPKSNFLINSKTIISFVMSSIISLIIASGLGFFLMSCSENKNSSMADHTTSVIKIKWSPQMAAQASIKVIDENNQPIADASVLIGQAINSPFSGNLIKTDRNGLALAPAAWTTSASVTIDATNYIRQTLVDLSPGDLVIRMPLASDAATTTLQGEITGLPVVNGDKLIDYALVMPAFSRLDMLNFSLDLAISPISESISVANRNVDVPTNLSLPTQIERYLLFNVTLSKPIYHLNVPFKGRKTFYAASGRFPIEKIGVQQGNPCALIALISR